jgi:hypothetical protein
MAQKKRQKKLSEAAKAALEAQKQADSPAGSETENEVVVVDGEQAGGGGEEKTQGEDEGSEDGQSGSDKDSSGSDKDSSGSRGSSTKRKRSDTDDGKGPGVGMIVGEDTPGGPTNAREAQALHDVEQENLQLKERLAQMEQWRVEHTRDQAQSIRGSSKKYLRHPDLQKFVENRAPIM